MRVRIIRIAYGTILIALLLGTSVFSEEKDLEKVLKDSEIKILIMLSEYDRDRQISFLQEAHKAIEGINIHFEYKGWETRAHRVQELRLRVLNKCFKERDYTYDLDNVPRLPNKVIPPRWAAEHQVIIAGMRPEDIIDPEARKQYEVAIAENNQKLEKYLQEKGLQYIIDREMRNIAIYMVSAQDDPGRQRQILSSLDALIESKILREKIMDAFEERLEKHKDATRQR